MHLNDRNIRKDIYRERERARVFEREEEKNKEKTKKIRIDDNMHSWYQMEWHENSFHDDFIIIIVRGGSSTDPLFQKMKEIDEYKNTDTHQSTLARERAHMYI